MSSSAMKRSLPIVIICGTTFAAYIISTAVLSPSPPLQDLMFGKILIVFVWIAFTALFSYSRACIAQILRNTSTGHKSLFFCGVFTQIGSAFGAILMFSLIEWTKIFNPYYPCT
jgi:riboflavin transporter 2